MKDLKLASVLTSWKGETIPYPLYMWALIDISTGQIVKFFLFYKQVKFNNITRKESGVKTVREWAEGKREELGLSPSTRGEFLVKRYRQENSSQIKEFLKEIEKDFDVTYLDDLASKGLPWADTLIDTLLDVGGGTEEQEAVNRLLTTALSKDNIVFLRKAFTKMIEKFHLSVGNLMEKPEVVEGLGDEVAAQEADQMEPPSQPSVPVLDPSEKVEASSQSPMMTPDMVILPREKKVWLRKVGEDLEEWAVCEDNLMSHKPIREAWTEAVKIKRNIEQEIAVACSQIAASQETMLEKQDITTEKVQRLTEIVEDIKAHLEKKKKKRKATRPLRDGISFEMYQELMKIPAPRYTPHAHGERARRRIVYTLLYYTGARINELRRITHEDLLGVIRDGQLKLVLHKQNDAIVRIVATAGREAMKKLIPEMDFLFGERGFKILGQSTRNPGKEMNEKSWITYVNKEITGKQKAMKGNRVLSSHSFRVGFITRHLKHAESHVVSKLVGHKDLGTTLKYNRYPIDEEKEREVLDRGYKDQPPVE